MLYYAISSSMSYKDISIPILLDSLKTKNPILVCISGFNEYKIENNGAVTNVYLNFNCYDYSVALSAVKILHNNDYIFWLHDTCKAGDKFDDIINSFDYTKYELVDVYNGYCNFGIYSVAFLKKHVEWILSCKNISKADAVRREMYFLDQCKKKSRFKSREGILDYKRLDVEDVYHTGHLRLVEYYGNIDLYKYKANWHMKKNNDWAVNI